MASTKAKGKAAPPRKKRKRSDDGTDDDSPLLASDASSNDDDESRPPISTSEAELSEAHRLKALAYSKGLLTRSSSSSSSSSASLSTASAASIPPSLLPYSHCDVENKSQSRSTPRFLCLFPGQFKVLPNIQSAIKSQHEQARQLSKAAAHTSSTTTPSPTPTPPTDPSIIGRIGSISSLDTRNPTLTLDFPQGQLTLHGTLVYPSSMKLLALQYSTKVGKKVKPMQCRGTFDHLIVFSEWRWRSRGEGAVEGGREQIPRELLQGSTDALEEDDEGVPGSQELPATQHSPSDGVGDDDEEEEEDDGGGVEAKEVDMLVVSDGEQEEEEEDEQPRSEAAKLRSRAAGQTRRRRAKDEGDSEVEMEEEEQEGDDEGERPMAASRPRRSSGEVNYAVDVVTSDEDEEEEDVGEEDGKEELEDDEGGDGKEGEEDEAEAAVMSAKRSSQPRSSGGTATRSKRRGAPRKEEEEDEDEEEEEEADGGDDNEDDEDYED